MKTTVLSALAAPTWLTRRALAACAWPALTLLVLVLWPVAQVALFVAAHHAAPELARFTPAPASASASAQRATPHDPSRRTVVVVTGNGGAELSDFLIPYEALGATGAFNLYAVAPERRLVPLSSAMFRDGGLDLLPHYSLQELDARGIEPDLIVVPFLPAFAAGGERALVPWLRKHGARGALVVSVCAGTEVVAASGLLDGQVATSHPEFVPRFEAQYPRVRWRRGVRYEQSERVISSSAIASGMDATLAAIRRLLGRGAAEDVAKRLGYAHVRFLDARRDVFVRDLGLLAGAYWPADERLGVALYEGVSEQALGSLFDTQTLGHTVVSVAATREVVRSRHGLQLVPRHALADEPVIDGVIVPGDGVSATTARALQSWTAARDLPLTYGHPVGSGFAYDPVLQALARRESRSVAVSMANNLHYPVDHLELTGPEVPRSLVLVPALLVACVWLLRAAVQRRRRSAAPSTVLPGSKASVRSSALRSSRTLPGHG